MTPERLKQIEDNVRAHQADRPGMVSPGWALRVAPELIAHIWKLEAENERLRKQWGYRNAQFLDELETSAAGATDLMNQWARQCYVEEAQDERGLHALAGRLWDAAMAEVQQLRAKIEAMGGGEG